MGDEKILVELLVVLSIQQIQNLAAVKPVKFHRHGLLQYFRLKRSILISEYTNLGGKITIDLHEAQSNKTVEPSISSLFHHLRKTLAVDLRDELVTLFFFRFGKQSTSDHIQTGSVLAVLSDLIFICFLLGSLD